MSTFTFQQVADDYLRSPAAIKSRDKSLPQRLAFWTSRIGHMTDGELCADAGWRLLQDLLGELAAGDPDGKPRAQATVNRYRAVCQAVCTHARKRRLWPRGCNPWQDIEQPAEDNARVRSLTAAEEAALMTAARASRNRRLALAIRLAIDTGLRLGSQQALRWRDIRLDAETPCILVQRTKNGQPHASPITPRLLEMLRAEYGTGLPGDWYVFPSPDNPFKPGDWREAFKRALALAQITDFHWHDIRHTSASRLAEAGLDLLQIAEHMGHKTLSMTRRYSHLSVKSRAEAVNKVFGY